jgi:HD-GYP domain-containing protein (c-di-GMP phosphodiesterase class II)
MPDIFVEIPEGHRLAVDIPENDKIGRYNVTVSNDDNIPGEHGNSYHIHVKVACEKDLDLKMIRETAIKKPWLGFLLITDSGCEPRWLCDNVLIWSFLPLSELSYSTLNSIVTAFYYLFKKISDTNTVLQNQIKELNDIGIALSSEKNLDTLLYKILLEIRKFANADAGSLYIREGDELIFKVTQNDTIKMDHNGEMIRDIRIPISKNSISGFAASTLKTITIEDVYNLPSTSSYKHDTVFDEKFNYHTKSVLAIPMKDNQGELIGVVQVINALDKDSNPVPFSPKIVPLIESLASQAAVSIKNAKLMDEVNILLLSLLEYSASLIDARSRHTAGHSHRVSHLTLEIARAISFAKEGIYKDIRFNEDEMQELYFAALLHDIGKIGIPEEVLDKNTKLSADKLESVEWRIKYTKALMRIAVDENKPITLNNEKITADNLEYHLHNLDNLWNSIIKVNESGMLADDSAVILKSYTNYHIRFEEEVYEILTKEVMESLLIRQGNLTKHEKDIVQNHINLTIDTLDKIPFPKHLSNVPTIAGMHHEKMDGSGYPRGIKGKDIPLGARILAIADFIDALSAKDRPYRIGLPMDKSLIILLQEATRGKFDIDLVKFIKSGVEKDEISFPWYIINEKEKY